MPRLFSYVVRHDYGFAPNPFENYCTLSTCKPQIREAARVGDWVIGTGSKQKGLEGRLVYSMRVDEVLTFDDYWADPRFARKVPTTTSSRKRAYGDNIYHHAADGSWVQEDSRHSLNGGLPNPGHIAVDTSSDRVLVSSRFSYFGGIGPEIPAALRSGAMDVVHPRQGHRCRFPAEVVQVAIEWLESLDTGVIGTPFDWD